MDTFSNYVCLIFIIGPFMHGLDGAKAAKSSADPTCTSVSLPMCNGVLPSSDILVRFPNTLGHRSESQVHTALTPFSIFMEDPKCGPHMRRFLCHLMAAPCTSPKASNMTSKAKRPCRSSCKAAYSHCHRMMKSKGLTWPSDFKCSRFPDAKCLHKDSKDIYHKATNSPKDTPKQATITVAQTLKELKIKPKVESKQSKSLQTGLKKTIKPRMYDITDLGEANMFKGWADVQGQGAANDYCRVIGKTASTRFLSCRLAGTHHDIHTYVSVRGLDVGHRGTWFMRDMDGDGRDDYCRCVGHGQTSKVSCMKAGKFGFYGSQTQGGNQYTFTIREGVPCIDKPVDPIIGLAGH